MKNRSQHPHRLAEWILRLVIPANMDASAPGDFEEIYRRIRIRDGRLRAGFWYWRQVARSLPPLVLDIVGRSALMGMTVIRNIYRHFRRRPVFSLINLTSLSLGIAACILAVLFLQNELGFDRFHSLPERVSRVIRHTSHAGEETHEPSTPVPLAEALRMEIPDLKAAAALILTEGWVVRVGDRMFTKDVFGWVEPEIFDILRFEFLAGSPESLTERPDAIALTLGMSRRLFGESDPIGKTVFFNRKDLLVTGLIRDLPSTSHLQLDALVPLSSWRTDLSSWDWPAGHTYVRTAAGISRQAASEKINRVWTRKTDGRQGRIDLQPLRDIHLKSGHLRWDYAARGNRNTVTIIISLAVFLLVIGCVNFVNLSTARSAARSMEIGIRKVNGADRGMIARQIFSEALGLAFLALGLGILLVEAALTPFNSLAGTSLSFQPLSGPVLPAALLGIVLLAGFLSGIYPALFYSAFRPADILKRRFSSDRGAFLRNGLVIFQFAVSIFLIFGTVVMQRQIRYMRNKDLGFDKHNIVVLMALGGFYSDYEALKTELLGRPDILGVAKGFQPVWHEVNTTDPDWEGKPEAARIAVQCFRVDYDYFQTYGMEMASGRAFSRDFSTDPENFILNETAASAMGLESPLGKRLAVDGREGRVIGVVRDFHHGPLHFPIQPVVFGMGDQIAALNIRIHPDHTKEALGFIESVWKRAVPGHPFEYHYLDDRLNEFYAGDVRLEKIFTGFSRLSVFIACLGLFGLACFTAERRTREIGIRKVLGASSGSIMGLLTRDFLKLLLIALAAAWPIGWLILHSWLNGFAYRAPIGAWPLLLSGGLTVTVALLTVNLQTWRAAAADPAHSLRTE